MKPFAETFLGRLRAEVGSRLLHVPAFRAVIEDSQGRVLLQLRSDFKVWGLPGGHPEENESLVDCVKREVTEETGLRLKTFHCFGYSSDPAFEITTYPNGDRIHTFALLVHAGAECWEGTLDAANEESLELRFFSPGQLPEMLENERRSLEAYFAFRRDGKFLAR